MSGTVMLAVALQNWDRFNAHALAARRTAAAIARGTERSLYVLSVYEYYKIPTSTLSADASVYQVDRARQDIDDFMQERMETFVAPLRRNGLEVNTVLEVGNPRLVILKAALEYQADVLVMGSHSKRGVFDIAIGGTAQQVISQASCEVVLVSPKKLI